MVVGALRPYADCSFEFRYLDLNHKPLGREMHGSS